MYGELYTFQYKDFPLKRLTTVKILREGFTGESTEILAAGEPIIIESKTDDNYLFSQLYGSTCEIKLISQTSMQFVDLFSANAFKHKVEVWKEPEPDETQLLFWTGFILPDQYSEPLDFITNYEVSITARDVIGGLKDINFLQPSGNRYIGKQQVIRIIAECLKKTQLNIPINFAVDLEETNAPDGATSDPLEMIFLDYSVFYQKDTDEKTQNTEYVLKQILQSFGCRLVQSWGEWYIEQIMLYTGAHQVHHYTYEGIYINSSSVNPVKTYTGKFDYTNNRLFFAEKQGLLEINPAFKGFVINQDYGKLPSIFKNYDFKQGYYPNPYPSEKFYPFDYDRIIYDINTFVPNSDIENINSLRKSNFTDGLIFMDTNNVSIKTTQIEVSILTTKRLKVEIPVQYFSIAPDIWLEIKIGNTWFVLMGTSGEECTTSATVYYNHLYYPNHDGPESISFILTGSFNGFLTIRLGGRAYAATKILTEFLDQYGAEYPEGAEFDVTIDENNNEKPDEIDSILGDLPELTDNEDIYIGGYWYFNGTDFIPTKSWTVPGSLRNLVLLAWLAENINDQYITPKHKISGRMIGNFGFNSSLLIPFMTNKIYLPNRLSLSDKYCKWTVEMIELLNIDNESGRVLATNDDKVITNELDYLIKV